LLLLLLLRRDASKTRLHFAKETRGVALNKSGRGSAPNHIGDGSNPIRKNIKKAPHKAGPFRVTGTQNQWISKSFRPPTPPNWTFLSGYQITSFSAANRELRLKLHVKIALVKIVLSRSLLSGGKSTEAS